MSREIHKIIRDTKQRTRKSIIKLPNLWWSIFIVVLTAVLLIGSYLLFEPWPWAANVLISAGCGCFTGLVFYFLSNLRNNKNAAVQREYIAIKETFKLLKSIIDMAAYHRFFSISRYGKRDVMEDGFVILSALDDLESARNNVPFHIYDTVKSVGYDPMDRDNIASYKKLLNEAQDSSEMKNAMRTIHQELMLAYEELTPLLDERANQLIFLGSHLV